MQNHFSELLQVLFFLDQYTYRHLRLVKYDDILKIDAVTIAHFENEIYGL